MSFQTTETIQRLWETFLRDQLAGMQPEERQKFEQPFEQKFGELLKGAASGAAGSDSRDGFLDLVGFGDKGAADFDQIAYPFIQPDFDEAVVPSQLHAAAELYYIYQHERMKIFEVVDALLRLFRLGKMRIQRGPGARGLYLLEKWQPLRYKRADRMVAYRRAFNYGTAQAPAGAVVNRNFHRQLVGFMASVAQYFRDLLIGEVIRGGQLIEQRPFGSVATVQRIGLDLRYALDRSTYGNILLAGHGDRPPPEDRVAVAGRARHQEGLRRQHQVGRGGDGVQPLPRRRGRALAAREDGRERAPHPAVRGRQRLQDRHRPGAVPERRAADGRTCRSLGGGLPHDTRGPQLPRSHAGAAGRARHAASGLTGTR